MARQLDHVLGQGDGVVHATEIVEVAREPFVVVSEVVNLVRHHAVAHHVGVVDPGAGFLLPGSVLVTLKFGIGVAGHVPHVGNTG